MRSKIRSLQGLRFWAITLIVASHCGILLQGGVGNCIFFALSGFLATRPFSSVNENHRGFFKIFKFYEKKVFRIIPVYWSVLLIAHFLFNCFLLEDIHSFDSLLLNMLFVKTYGHLWFLQQEVFFYIILPFILIVLSLLNDLLIKLHANDKIRPLLLFILLTTSSIASERLLSSDVFYLNGNSSRMRFFLGCFLAGMGFSYLYKYLLNFSTSLISNKAFRLITNIYVFLFLFFTIFTAEPILSYIDTRFTDYFIGWEHTLGIVCTACILIIVLILYDNSLSSRFLSNNWFNYIGNLSYIIYLIHFFLLRLFSNANPIQKFMGVYLLSIALSIIIHNLIEKPIIQWSNDKSNFSFGEYYAKLLTPSR